MATHYSFVKREQQPDEPFDVLQRIYLHGWWHRSAVLRGHVGCWWRRIIKVEYRTPEDITPWVELPDLQLLSLYGWWLDAHPEGHPSLRRLQCGG